MDGKQIPTFIGSLSRLRYLDLSSANFGGRIPFQLGNLSNLQYLNIANNGLNVSRLAWLSHLHKLKYLLMYSLDLRGSIDLLQVISGLPSLKHLNLGSSLLPITDYPSLSLVNTSSTLAYLDLFSCGLSNSAYDWLFNVSSNLHTLYLYNNHLKGPIPDHAFWNMTSLVNPDLSFNQISTIPRIFFLERTAHFQKQIKWFFPEAFQQPSSLVEQYLDRNWLWGSILDLSVFPLLKVLDISSNQLNGTVNEGLGQLSKLEQLILMD
ncbi:receptor-like protein EIX2 [Mangifera indica]|uniref:receptor-like protein EIX2 n=1 Tax=Mangifera indica TaxID=29780 RepID=UPI001CFB9C49|nr:receptor-like protein EIX2 [Mangifera indica]